MASQTLDDILKRLRELEAELETEIDSILTEKRKQFQYSLEQGKVRFENGIKSLQRYHKVGLIKYLSSARLGHILSAPVIYSLLFPFLLIDLMVSIYQLICFRIYGVSLVRRKQYIIVDRQSLAYLNIIEKINCIYCGYCNGVIEYVREVAARTEQYWCPIKHARRSPDPHRLVDNFLDYGDAEAYQERFSYLEQQIADLKANSHIDNQEIEDD